MKILLDECVPWPLHKVLPGHECQTAQQCGWGGIKNGELLKRMESQFDLFITADQNLRYQQNLAGRRVAIIQLSTNKLRPLLAASDALRTTIANIQPAQFVMLDIPE